MDTNRKMGRPGALSGVLPEEIQHLTGTSELHSKSSLTSLPLPLPLAVSVALQLLNIHGAQYQALFQEGLHMY